MKFKWERVGSLLLLSVMLSGCAQTLHLINFQSGQRLEGKLSRRNNSVEVQMPDGEKLRGSYSHYAPSKTILTEGVRTRENPDAESDSSAETVVKSDAGEGYSVLTGDRGTVMEMKFKFAGESGFGEAVTNRGVKYKVQF